MEDDDGLAHDDPLLRSDAGGAAMPQSPTPQAVIAKMAEMEVDADSHEAAIDAELRGIAAAAAGEIDAFLAEAQKQVTPVGGARTVGRRSVRSSAELRASRDADAQNAEDERRVRATLTHYDGAKRALKTLSARMEQVQREIEALEDDDRGVRDEMDGTIEPDAGAVAMGAVDDEVMRSVPRRRRLEREASEYAEEIARRTEELERLDVEVYNARRELIEAETNVVFVDEIRGEVAEREASNLVSDAVKVADISRTDAEALRRYEAARHAAYTRERTRKAIYKERERFVVEAGRASRRDSYRRVNEKLKGVREHLEAAASHDAERHSNDTRRLLELKHSTDKAFEHVTKYVAAKASFHEQRKADRRREAAELLAKGRNPYLVFQEREEASRVLATERRNAKNHEMRMEQIRTRLSKEEKESARRKAEAAKKKELDRAYTKTLGRRAREERTKKYMEGATRAGVDLLDATGRNVVFPSQVSRAAPRNLGLGGLRDDPEHRKMVIDDVAPGAKPLPSMLTERERELQGIGVGSLGKEYEPSWNAGPDRGTGGTSHEPHPPTSKDDDGVGLEEAEDEDVVKNRRRRSALLKMESERLKVKAKERFADPDRLYSSQVVCGREFAGDSFMPSPKRGFLFADFELGQTYKMKISMTNVSYSIGTFKVMDMEYPYSSLFDVEYAPPGRMSAGMSTTIHVTFTPRTMDPIECHLPLSTNTGIVRVPIECRPKSAEVYLVNETLDFPETLVGERTTLFAQLINEGAIEVPFVCEYPEAVSGKSADSSPFTIRVRGSYKETKDGGREPSAEGVVPSYGSAFIMCEFAPRIDGVVEEDVRVRLGEPLNVDAVVKLRAVAGPLPVHLDGRTSIDFKGITLGCVYRDALVVKNRANAAARCVLRIPECLLGSCEIIPDMLFCQAGAEASFSVKMTPNAKTAERCKKYVNPETGCIEVPMKVTTPGQNLPVPFTLRALLTSSDLTFDPPLVDFGVTALGEASAVKVKVTNHARLMQTFGFSDLPEVVSVAPSPYGEVLAGETIEVELRYAPIVATVGTHEFTVAVKTLLGARVFDLPCIGRGVRPALEMTGNVVTLPPTAAREMSHGVVVVRNNSKRRTETFEFVVPESASHVLRVSPHVGTLGPGEGARVRVEFCPEDPTPPSPEPEPEPEPELDEDGNPIEKQEGEGGEGEGDPEADADAPPAEEETPPTPEPEPEPTPEPEAPQEPKRDVWRIPVFIKAATSASTGDDKSSSFDPEDPEASDDDDEWVGHPTMVQHVEVRAVTRGSSVVVDNLVEVKGSKELTYDLDFGHVAVGDRTVKSIQLRNLANTSVNVGMSAPDHEGVFTALTAFRPLDPLGDLEVKLAFQPGRCHSFYEIISLKTSLRTIRIAARGEGISPALDVTPADVVDCGDAVPGDCKNTTLTLTNPTAFPQRWRAEIRDAVSHGNTSRFPFTFSPSGGVIAANESVTVTLSFTPDRAGYPYGTETMFRGSVCVVVPGLVGAETRRELRARCWADGAFIVGADCDDGSPAVVDDVIDTVGLRSGLREPPVRAPYESIVLTLPGPIRPGESASASLAVGSVKDADGKGSNAEFSFAAFEPDDAGKGWSVDEGSGSVPAGERKTVTFSFAYPATPRPTDPCYFGAAETVRCDVVCTLKGGDPAPAEEEGREVRVTLRCELLPPFTDEEKAAMDAEEAAKKAAEEGAQEQDGDTQEAAAE